MTVKSLTAAIREFGHEVCKCHFGTPTCGTWFLIDLLDVARIHSETYTNNIIDSLVDKHYCKKIH